MCRSDFLMLAILFWLCFACCDKRQDATSGDDRRFDVTWPSTEEDFCNPERGFYHQYTLKFSDGNIPSPVSPVALKTNRVAKRTLSLTLFYLTDFMDGDISQEALEVIRQSLQAHRDGGCKAILRFAYKDGYGESFHPFDAPVDVVLRHVAQLKPIFHEYGDVIYVLQAGFVGAWGEWYYTDHFNFQPETPEDYEPRRRLVEALLDAMPEDRQVALRTAGYKMKIFGTSVKDSITVKTAFDGSDLSRIAGHNDCFISDPTDLGTFTSEAERELWMAETDYVSMGGETCSGNAAYCDCAPAYVALESYHWSYLNHAYHSGTFDLWKRNGCHDDISRRLGYRLVLEGANFRGVFSPGEEFTIDIGIRNEGFASLVNGRSLEFVLVGEDGSEYVFGTDDDPRSWKGGNSYRIRRTLSLPSALEPGKEYTLCLNLPDASGQLRDKPEFSVRLANKGVWNPENGYNELKSFVAE